MSDETPPVWPVDFVASAADRDAALILASLRGTSARRMVAAAQRHAPATALLEAVRAGVVGSERDRVIARSARVHDIRMSLDACGARAYAVGEPGYPGRLADLADPPLVVFARGRALGTGPSVLAAIVGARSASPSGREVATEMGRRLAEAGVGVVSGAARGIDAAAHDGALAGGGRTVAVLGSGIDVAYPSASSSLIARIARAGTLLSEYPPGVPAEAFRFPARNRIIAALVRCVIVVEGEDGSGSLITAEHALDLGRDVMAVPGAVAGPLSAVPNALIREGAELVRDADDVLASLGVELSAARSVTSRMHGDDAPGLADDERRVLAAITHRVLPESIARAVGLPIEAVIRALVVLELQGAVRSIGGRFEPRLRPADLNATRRLGRRMRPTATESTP